MRSNDDKRLGRCCRNCKMIYARRCWNKGLPGLVEYTIDTLLMSYLEKTISSAKDAVHARHALVTPKTRIHAA